MNAATRTAAAMLAIAAAILLPPAGGRHPGAFGQERPRVAVLTLDSREAQEEAESIAEELRQQFVNSGRYTVIDRTLTSKIAEEWATQQSGLTEREKAVQVGKLYNVQLLVTGKLNKFSGGGWQVSAVVVDLQSGITRRAATVRHRGDFFSLLDQKVPQLARTLLEVDPAVSGPAAAAPLAPLAPAPPAPAASVALKGLFSERAPLAVGRHHHAGEVVGGRIYIFGGETGDGTLNTVDVYDPAQNRWESHPPMPTPRSFAASAGLGERIYLIGGQNENKILSRVDVYDPGQGNWSAAPPLQTPRKGAAAAVLQGRIYVFGGTDAESGIPDLVEVLEPGATAWSNANAPMLHPRAFLSAVAVGERIYVMGGTLKLGGVTAWMEMFEPQRHLWSPTAALRSGRSDQAAVSLGNQLHVFGGWLGTLVFLSPGGLWDAYDPGQNRWEAKGKLPMGRIGFTAHVVSDRVYLVGGLPEGVGRSVLEVR